MTAGYVASIAYGTTYEDMVRHLILDPLGMKQTQFSVQISKKMPNHATGYVDNNGQLEPIPLEDVFNIVPAGGINSNVRELANWTMLHLNHGTFNGKQILTPDRVEQLHTVVMPMSYEYSFNAWFPFMWEMGYGLGRIFLSTQQITFR